MSFTDPFNRVSSKQVKEYHAFSEQLKQAGIDTEKKARTMLRKSRNFLLGLSSAVVVITILISLLWPKIMGIVTVFAGLTLIWLIITMARGKSMTNQFIRNEFARKPDVVKDRSNSGL